MAKRKTLAELESTLERERREKAALQEWFICEGRGHAVQTLDVETGSTSARPVVPAVRVTVHGMTRAAGGVCVVSSDGHRGFPVFLDDLCSDWERDSSKEIREAAALLRRRREEQVSLRDSTPRSAPEAL